MRPALITICLFVCSLHCSAQQITNYLQVVTNTSMDFVINTVSDIENNHVRTNAYTINCKTVANDCHVYAKLDVLTSPTGWTLPAGAGKFQAVLASTTSTSATNVQTAPFIFTSNDLLMFREPQMSVWDPVRNWNYHFTLLAPGYNYFAIGFYTFRITISMTQP